MERNLKGMMNRREVSLGYGSKHFEIELELEMSAKQRGLNINIRFTRESRLNSNFVMQLSSSGHK